MKPALISALILFLALPPAAQQVAPAAQVAEKTETREITRGVKYTSIRRATPAGEPWSIHVLEVSWKERKLAVEAVHAVAAGEEMRRVLPTAIAATRVAAGANVLGVVNGDYDIAAPYLGISDGLDVSSGAVFTTGKPAWPAMAVRKNGEPLIGVPHVEITLRAGPKRLVMAALNKPLGSAHGNGPRLFTRDFRAAVKSEKTFRAVVIARVEPGLPLRVDGKVRGKVERVVEGTNEIAIPVGGLIVAEAQAAASGLAELKVGEKVEIEIRARMNGQKNLRHVIGGFPVLVQSGRRNIIGTPSENLSRRHPRTAVCYNESAVIFAVVDGRQPQLSVGMTLEELADLMLSLGCQEAMNTDGGGSSVIAVALTAEGSATQTAGTSLRIVNSPSDGQERGRGNAWIVVKRK